MVRLGQHLGHLALDDALAPGPRRSRSCRRRGRRRRAGCSWCGGTGSGWCARPRSRGRSADRSCPPRLLVEVDAVVATARPGRAAPASPRARARRAFARRAPCTGRGWLRPGALAMPWLMKFTASSRVMSCDLQEIDGMALALAEQRHQHVGAGHLVAAGGLHMDRGALHHALEAGGRLGVAGPVGGQAREVLVEELGQVARAACRDRRRRRAARWPRRCRRSGRAAGAPASRIRAGARWRATGRGGASVRDCGTAWGNAPHSGSSPALRSPQPCGAA